MKIEEYLKSLPDNIISGEDVQLPEHSYSKIFEFLNLNEKDVFYHLGCGGGEGIAIALEKFNVKKAVGIDNNQEKIRRAKKLVKERKIKNAEFLCKNVLDAKIDDATACLLYTSDAADE